MSDRPTHRICLTIEGTDVRRLARVLKALLRAAGWRCTAIQQQPPDHTPADKNTIETEARPEARAAGRTPLT